MHPKNTSKEKRKRLEVNLEMSKYYEDARKLIYGMPYPEWKEKYQIEATKEQMEKYKGKKF